MDDAWYHLPPIAAWAFQEGKECLLQALYRTRLNLTQPWGEGLPGPGVDIPAVRSRSLEQTLSTRRTEMHALACPCSNGDSVMPGTLWPPKHH